MREAVVATDVVRLGLGWRVQRSQCHASHLEKGILVGAGHDEVEHATALSPSSPES